MLIALFLLKISGQTHRFIIYAIMMRYCLHQIEVSFFCLALFSCFDLPYLPVYKSIPCISRPPIFDGKKSNFLISLLNVHGILILHSSISGTVDSQKIKGLKRLIVLWFSSCCVCGHFVLEFRKGSQKIEHVNLKLTCFVVQR